MIQERLHDGQEPSLQVFSRGHAPLLVPPFEQVSLVEIRGLAQRVSLIVGKRRGQAWCDEACRSFEGIDVDSNRPIDGDAHPFALAAEEILPRQNLGDAGSKCPERLPEMPTFASCTP